MLYRTAALASMLTLALTGCNNTDKPAADNGRMYAESNAARNVNCPVCGMPADAQYSVTQDGKTVDCCSQACRDRFSNASAADQHRMMGNASNGRWSSTNGPTYGPVGVTQRTHAERSAAADKDIRNSNAHAESSVRMENDYSPISGKAASQNYVVDEDGHRIGFATQQEADLYRSYGPEHRAELRSHMK